MRRFSLTSTTGPSRLIRGDSNASTSSSADTTPVVASGELLGLQVEAQIPFTQVGYDGKNIVTHYVIRCSFPPPPGSDANTPCKKWDIKRRYGQFHDLDKNLRSAIRTQQQQQRSSGEDEDGADGITNPAKLLVSLPPKRLLSSFEDSVINERKRGLVMYLQSAFRVCQPGVQDPCTAVIAKFLEMPGSQGFRPGPLVRLAQTNEDRRSRSNSVVKESTAGHNTTGEAHHGFLKKRGGLHQNKPFKMAFFVLNYEDGMLNFYRTDRPELLGSIVLHNQPEGKVEELEPGDFAIPEDGFGFRIFTPDRELIVYSDTEEIGRAHV